MRRLWKRTEERIAEYLGATRIPITGRARGDRADIDHPNLSIEVKHRRTAVPKWMLEGMDQAEASAVGDQLPVLIIHPHGGKIDDDLVVMRLSEFRARVWDSDPEYER